MIILSQKDIADIFLPKIEAARWLVKNGNETDREVASVTLQTIESICSMMAVKSGDNHRAATMSRLALETISALQLAA